MSRLGEYFLRDVLAVLHGEEARTETAVVTGKGEGGYRGWFGCVRSNQFLLLWFPGGGCSHLSQVILFVSVALTLLRACARCFLCLGSQLGLLLRGKQREAKVNLELTQVYELITRCGSTFSNRLHLLLILRCSLTWRHDLLIVSRGRTYEDFVKFPGDYDSVHRSGGNAFHG